MSFEVQGRLHKKFEVAQITNTFKKREFVVELENGGYSEYIKFQLLQERCSALDPYNEGDNVNVHFNLKGRPYTNKNNETIYFTNLTAWRVEGPKAEGAEAAPKQQKSTTSSGGSDFPTTSDEVVGDINNDDLPF